MEVPYDYRAKKSVVVLSTALPPGVAANALGHLALSLGAWSGEGMMGRRTLPDGSGTKHAGISRYPVIVTQAKPGKIRQAVESARLDPSLFVADYPRQMLDTGHDDELAAALAAVPEASLDYLAVALYGPADAVSAITGKFSLWRPSLPVPESSNPVA